MVVYEVNLDISDEIFDQFIIWLNNHVKAMMQFKGFKEAKILQEICETKNYKKITCSYLLDSQESLDDYFMHHAPSMRQDGINQFGDKFSAVRRIFDVIESVKPD